MDCRICSAPAREVFVLRSQRHGVEVPVFRCGRCDAYFSDGGPVNYANVNLTGHYVQHQSSIRARYERVFDRVESLMEPARFLDIGAGMGFSLEVARRRGCNAGELEPHRALVEHARQRQLDVECGYLDDSRRGEHDFILVDDVLEHAAFLRNARRLLSRQALMLVAVPMDWLRRWVGAIPHVRKWATRPQINIFHEVDEHVNMLGRRAINALTHLVGLRVLPLRFHHSKAYDNAVVRALGLDDGDYFVAAS
jgi:2-polyprenyl-3-methyl-5-hydroxy-6-metoxy-1,4-benzoquinol methylase